MALQPLGWVLWYTGTLKSRFYVGSYVGEPGKTLFKLRRALKCSQTPSWSFWGPPLLAAPPICHQKALCWQTVRVLVVGTSFLNLFFFFFESSNFIIGKKYVGFREKLEGSCLLFLKKMSVKCLKSKKCQLLSVFQVKVAFEGISFYSSHNHEYFPKDHRGAH